MLCTKNYINSACHYKNNFGDDINVKRVLSVELEKY